jgi:P27 family predicted phage terminase small subunit
MGGLTMPKRPQPTALKLLRGNPGKRPLNTAEPKPRADGIQAPAWLNADARAKWNELFAVLQSVGLLTQADAGPLARYCDTWAWWRRCRETIEREGDTLVIRDDSGNEKYRQQRPEVGIVNKLAQQMHRLECEFGLTPAARSTMHVLPETPRDELEQFFAIHGA